MKERDYRPLLVEMADEYRRRCPRSAALNERARAVMVDGGSHTLRLIAPFPPRITAANGAYVTDEDGHQLLDFWQGHFANILGHNPPVIAEAMAELFARGAGLQTGFTERVQIETAEVLCRQTGAERARFTTSGSLATMYAIMLARAHTRRLLVMKVNGGWHGAQPWGLKGVGFHEGAGFEGLDSAGLPPALADEIVLTRFNDPQMLEDHFRRYGDRLACFILEPFMGAAGGLPATLEYLQTARRLTEQYGVVLIMDEVIAGFRFRAGNLAALYGVQPDLATFGKIMGGGMPVTAVAGRADILQLAGRAAVGGVKFSGGTYSGHPAAMLAAQTMMTYLAEHEAAIYPRLANLARQTVTTVEAAFAAEGIYAVATGLDEAVGIGGSVLQLHFPYEAGKRPARAEDTLDPAVCDHALNDRVVQLALLLEDVHVAHGLGALSAAHTEADVTRLGAACRRAAQRIKPYVI